MEVAEERPKLSEKSAVLLDVSRRREPFSRARERNHGLRSQAAEIIKFRKHAQSVIHEFVYVTDENCCFATLCVGGLTTAKFETPPPTDMAWQREMSKMSGGVVTHHQTSWTLLSSNVTTDLRPENSAVV
jgi:hypothetical protein